ncbi:MAG: SprT-like domain-containing protein [Campylobacterota bacterium]|nr:SprT-like domain-containing protein [Campylobacterota bacterium]
MKNLYKIFSTITIVSIVLLGYVIYNDNQFKNNDLSVKTITKLKQKEYSLRKLILQKYNIEVNIPVIVSPKLKDNLFGIAAYNNGDIKIVLNKNRFQESEDYMIDYVLPHEYAHALMFVFNDFPKENGGHSIRWQNICLSLDGKKCDRFVNHNDIVMGKLDFIY